MGVWSDATDNYDELIESLTLTWGLEGYAGIYHKQGHQGWTGPTGFYGNDHRAPPDTDKSKVWDSLYLWGDPINLKPTMSLSLEGAPGAPPGADREYFLELIKVPNGVADAPPVGTRWEVPAKGLFTVTVPTFRTENGLEGYRFALIFTEVVPEPATLGLLLPGLLVALPRRRPAR